MNSLAAFQKPRRQADQRAEHDDSITFATGNHEPCGEMARAQGPAKTPQNASTPKQVDAYHFGLRSENFSPFTALNWKQTPTHIIGCRSINVLHAVLYTEDFGSPSLNEHKEYRESDIAG